MTNEERIYKLCEYIMDLIDELRGYDMYLNSHLEWIKDEIKTIRQDIRSEEHTSELQSP